MATYKTAMGKAVDIDSLRVANENVIAVGNMRTNARGDELGAGGQIVKTRSQLMQEYHKLNTPVASQDNDIISDGSSIAAPTITKLVQPTAKDVPITASAITSTAPVAAAVSKPRGSFAGAVAGETEVKQELLTPLTDPNPGIRRI
jgi:hypothetical protein